MLSVQSKGNSIYNTRFTRAIMPYEYADSLIKCKLRYIMRNEILQFNGLNHALIIFSSCYQLIIVIWITHLDHYQEITIHSSFFCYYTLSILCLRPFANPLLMQQEESH